MGFDHTSRGISLQRPLTFSISYMVGEAKEGFSDEYNQHIKRKHDAQQSKRNDKAASQMYYNHKLYIYNLNVYNAAPPNNRFYIVG